jgi:hypothetical protein
MRMEVEAAVVGMQHAHRAGRGEQLVRISANVTDDFGNVTGLGPVLGCADLIVEMGSV